MYKLFEVIRSAQTYSTLKKKKKSLKCEYFQV